jgi:hypothetical protein
MLPRPLAVTTALLLLTSIASAQNLPSRATGGGGQNATVIEDFEAYVVGPNGADDLFVLSLDETTIANNQGPNLVLNGCTYSCTGYSLQWNDAGHFGLPSKSIAANTGAGGNGVITLTYDSPVTVIGFDMHSFQGFPDSAIIKLYDGGGTLIYTSSPISIPGPTAVPFTYTATSIGSVTIDGQGRFWSPSIDNHEFGSANVPTLMFSGTCPGPMTIGAKNCTPNGPVAFLYGAAGSFTKNGNPCNGLQLAIANPTLAGVVTANGNGKAAVNVNMPSGLCGRTVQALDVATCTPTQPLIL